MPKKWLSLVNMSLAGIGIFLLLASAGLMFARPGEIAVVDSSMLKSTLPRGAFVQSKAHYEAINSSLLTLKFSPANLQLPDLRKTIIFYGKNGRPDAQIDSKDSVLFFAFTGNKAPFSIASGEKRYILYDKRMNPPQYVFSPQNEETPLWIEATARGNETIVKVGMKSENGDIIHEPSSYAQFELPEKEYARIGNNTPWEIGKFRVDGSLLARQKARWYGSDRFMQMHGGQEYNDLIGKQRIDFGEGEDNYSIYLGPNDTVVWDEGVWKVVKPGPQSLGHPLMVVKKVDERLMNLELWDVDGKAKIALNLLRSNENWVPQHLEESFKFVGARTRSQFVFEVNNERMLLAPHDWLVLTEEGWQKLTTPEEIDDYVNRKVTGPLFVFDGVTRKDDRQVLLGEMYNASRTDMQEVELPVSGNGANENPKDAERLKNGADHGQMPFARNKDKLWEQHKNEAQKINVEPQVLQDQDDE
jgi:hypothetical protein